MPIALSMIVSGTENPDDLKQALESVKGQVDASFITITTESNGKLKELAESMGAVVDYQPDKFFYTIKQEDIDWIKEFGLKTSLELGDKIFLFDAARNYCMDLIPKTFDWIFWIDVDDVLRGSKLREIAKLADDNKAESVFMNYLYQVDLVDGKVAHVLIEHLRERLIKNNGAYKWVAPIHETLIEQRPTRKIDTKECDILHLSDQNRKIKAIYRNIKVLEYALVLCKAKDPRPVYYLAKAYFDVWLNEQNKDSLQQAKKLFEMYLDGPNPSGWTEERAQCWEYLVETYRSLGEINNAIKCAHNSMIEDERFPSVYINLALCYLYKMDYNRALFWVRLGTKIDQPDTTLVSSPKDLQSRTLEIIFHCALNTSKIDEAMAAAEKLCELHPGNKEFVDRVNLTRNIKNQSELTKIMTEMAKYLESSGEMAKIKPLLDATPELIKDNPFMIEWANKVNPPRVHSDNEISIYVGPCFTTWSPKSLINPGQAFIGGSEEAVIYQSLALTKKGWKVAVYADPGVEEGVHDGVEYLPYYKWNKRDEFNIVIGWRRPDFVDQEYKSKKNYIWCHDILNPQDFTEERLKKITKVMVLSPWHRKCIPDVPDGKILLTSNGVNL